MKIYNHNTPIQKIGWTIIILFLSLLIIPHVGAQEKESIPPSDTIYLDYYTGIGCPSCKKIDSYISAIDEKHDLVVIRSFEVYRDKENFKKMIKTYNDQGVGWDKHWVPVVFFKDICLVGYTEIQDRLDKEIIKRLELLHY